PVPFSLTTPAPTALYILSLHDALPICGSAHISHQVAQRHIGLVADRGNHRDGKRGHRPRDALVVEGPEILARPTAPADDLWTFKDRKSTRLNSSHVKISYAVFCLKKKK